RTEILNANREASRFTMQQNSNVVAEWVWYASIGTCCGACLAKHGHTFPLDQPMQSHPSCRCAMVPRTDSWADLGIPMDDDPYWEIEQAYALEQIYGVPKTQLVDRFGPSK